MKRLRSVLELLKQYEPYFFGLAVLLNLLPLMTTQFFGSLDGPAHLYNAKVIGDLWFEEHNTLHEVFAINSSPVPNWLGHFLLVLFTRVLPDFMAEKALLVFCLVALCYSFRGIVLKQQPEASGFSYFIFPFTYSMFFCFGFYNFMIAVAIAFKSFSIWINFIHHKFKLRDYIFLFLLLLSCYFSHVFVFMLLIACVICYTTLYQLQAIIQNPTIKKGFIKLYLKQLIIFLSIGAIPIIFCLDFLLHRDEGSERQYASMHELKNWLSEFAPLSGFLHQDEMPYHYIFALCLLLLLLFGGFSHLKHILRSSKIKQNLILKISHPSNTWLLVSMVLLLMYFYYPNIEGGAGFVSLRVLFLSLLFFTIWVLLLKANKWLLLIIIPTLFFCRYQTALLHVKVLNQVGEVASDFYKLGKHIKPHSVVLTIDVKTNWMYGHFTNYIGLKNPVVLLDNYECESNYFPVQWNVNELPNYTFGEIEASELLCLKWKSDIAHKARTIDYVLVNGSLTNMKDSCQLQILPTLNQYYTLVSSSINYELFGLKIKHGVN